MGMWPCSCAGACLLLRGEGASWVPISRGAHSVLPRVGVGGCHGARCWDLGSGSPSAGRAGWQRGGDTAVPALSLAPAAGCAGSQGQPSGSGWPQGSPRAAHANEPLMAPAGTRGDTAQGHSPACHPVQPAMPRSFLVKKPSSTRIPNYGQLEACAPVPPDAKAPTIQMRTHNPDILLKDTPSLNLPRRRRSFQCRHCARVYTNLSALKLHIRTHTLPYLCRLCGKAFSRPWLLQGHIRTHTGEKPYTCPHCSRAFADRSNLRAHLQTHSDVKKYQCYACAKTFSRVSLLARHKEGGCCGAS
ncbi:zinc finger protein SNAI3 [Cuculus canorus]|uniref:zinc finger protein SNAI3 n=1 Tax=Cuculus canorus TaxID=55661 RepID=UPI0023AA4857|nr:zinc finger protein SNAI3 [Cuculus canorus]